MVACAKHARHCAHRQRLQIMDLPNRGFVAERAEREVGSWVETVSEKCRVAPPPEPQLKAFVVCHCEGAAAPPSVLFDDQVGRLELDSNRRADPCSARVSKCRAVAGLEHVAGGSVGCKVWQARRRDGRCVDGEELPQAIDMIDVAVHG